MYTWDLIVSVISIWAIVVILFWPLYDYILVTKGKLPPVDGCDIQTIKKIHNKGFWYRYSAYKRFKASKYIRGKKNIGFEKTYEEYKKMIGTM